MNVINLSEDALFRDDIWETRGPRLTFAHAGEDRFLAVLFRRVEAGFYVDFGCFHPTVSSNTFLLHRRGWTGLNLDASPDAIEAMTAERPDDINIQMAIAESAGVAQLAYFGPYASSNTTSSEFASHIENTQGVKIERMIDVACDTTVSVLDKFVPAGRIIDYWNIDIESSDIVAIKTNNWEKYRPILISIEDFEFSMDNPDGSAIHRILLASGYVGVSRYLNTSFYMERGSYQANGLPRF